MYGKIQKSGLTEIIPLICISAIWGQYLVLSHLESPLGVLLGEAAVADGWIAGFLLLSLGPSGLTILGY